MNGLLKSRARRIRQIGGCSGRCSRRRSTHDEHPPPAARRFRPLWPCPGWDSRRFASAFAQGWQGVPS